VKNFRNISFKKQEYRIYQKSNQLFSYQFENCPSDMLNFEKIFKNYEDFLLKITGNSFKNLAIFGDVIIGKTPSPFVINRHHLDMMTSYVNDP
jgi:hypothetical protein